MCGAKGLLSNLLHALILPFMLDIAENLRKIEDLIRKASEKAGRAGDSAQLVAVGKTRPATDIAAALAAGQRIFGENRVQEAAAKFPSLRKEYPDLELHLIGPLQTNKVAEAVALFDVVETLDRPKLAEALAKEMKKQGHAPRLYIEVNIGREPQKTGINPEDAALFLQECRDKYGLSIEGLMAIPPLGQNPEPYFRELAALAKKMDLPRLSMGMSADFETAIACGATEVRIGTAIFGERNKP